MVYALGGEPDLVMLGSAGLRQRGEHAVTWFPCLGGAGLDHVGH